jgi:hypothetical protein
MRKKYYDALGNLRSAGGISTQKEPRVTKYQDLITFVKGHLGHDV